VKRAGVVGRPIGHSLSPVIHGAWIAALGLDAEYTRFEPEDEAAFARLVDQVRTGELAGLNVTSPFKDSALVLADEASDTARATGGANLLTALDDRVRADSTDGLGLLASLAEQAPELRLPGAAVVVLGAGGAARAAAWALRGAGADVGLLNRTPQRAADAAKALGVSVASEAELRNARLVVNALPVRPEIAPDSLAADAVLMDMTYRPLLTPFLAAGRARGLRTVDGLAMLIGQAGPSFQAIFGVSPPAGVDVRAACLRAMEAA